MFLFPLSCGDDRLRGCNTTHSIRPFPSPPDFFSCSQVHIDFQFGTPCRIVQFGDVVKQESLYFRKTQAFDNISNSVNRNTVSYTQFSCSGLKKDITNRTRVIEMKNKIESNPEMNNILHFPACL